VLYGPVESAQRLKVEGFHKKVTKYDAHGTAVRWARFAQSKMNEDKPSRDEYLEGGKGFKGTVNSVSRQLTRAPLIYRPEFMPETYAEDSVRDRDTSNILATILESPDVGGLIIELLFADGLQTVQKAALSCTRVWRILASASNIWDVNASQFRANGHNGVFYVTSPEYTIGEVRRAGQNPLGHDPRTFGFKWCQTALAHERNVAFMTTLTDSKKNDPAIQDAEGNTVYPDTHVRSRFEPRVFEVLEKIESLDDAGIASQFKTKNDLQLFTSPPGQGLREFRNLITKISSQHSAIRVLNFHRIPYLDPRVLAIVLRACPRVTMIGVYDCPLIHLGDVVCILDLIWEINQKRRKLALAPIKAFDFYPRYNEGMPYSEEGGATYGLTWSAKPLEVVQPGMYLLVLKAFMKCKAMNLDLLFSRKHAFVGYLNRLPLPPPSIARFLDALYRFMDLDPKNNTDYQTERKKILYDMMVPVRTCIDRMHDDAEKDYVGAMGKQMFTCCSCGYETHKEFFTEEGRRMQAHRRVCTGCTLSSWLDQERDHLKLEVHDILTCLFPKWRPDQFNHEAPIPTKGLGLVKLKTTEAARPSAPSMQLLPDGNFYQPAYDEPNIRDDKLHDDSLQSLPALEKLVGEDYLPYWHAANSKCASLEMFRNAVHWIAKEQEGTVRTGHPYIYNDIDERQYPDSPGKDKDQSLTFESAFQAFVVMRRHGWVM
jgi:hypothetical protein